MVWTRLADGLYQPEYTGENRCVPCTVVNVLLAVLISAVVSWLTTITVGVGVLLVCLATIQFRGYLVPGTPTLTATYLPKTVLRWFEKDASSAPRSGFDEQRNSTASNTEVVPEEVLFAARAIEECQHEDDLCLTPSFREEWYDRMEAIDAAGSEKRHLSRILDIDEEELRFEDYGPAFAAWTDWTRVGQWESRSVFVADIAAARVLESKYPRWEQLSIDEKSDVLYSLRVFLDSCPDCGGSVSAREEIESCCRSVTVVAIECEECGTRLFEAESEM